MVSNIDKLSSLIHFLSTAGFTSESSELSKLAGGALPIPQKVYDVCLKHMRDVVAFGIKKMFEDIPAKLAKVESYIKRTDQYTKLSLKAINDFGVLTDEEKAGPNDAVFSDGKYITIVEQLLHIPYYVDHDYLAEQYEVPPKVWISIAYGIDEGRWALYAGESKIPDSCKETFQHNKQFGELEDDLGWVIKWYEARIANWRSSVENFISDVKAGLKGIESINAPDKVTGSTRIYQTDDNGKGISDVTMIDTPRRFEGRSLVSIPIDLDGYKYFKDGVKYPKVMQLSIELFDKNIKPEKGKEDYRWGYFSQGQIYRLVSKDGTFEDHRDPPLLKVGIPFYHVNIMAGSGGNRIIDWILTSSENAIETLGHEMTHFGQYILGLNAGIEKTNFMTGKFPTNKEKKQYDTYGVLKLNPKQRLAPSGKMEWSLYSPTSRQYFWFGDTKPTDEAIREISWKETDNDGARLEHGSRDVEQKTRLHDELAKFRVIVESSGIRPEQALAAFKVYVGVSRGVSSGAHNKETIDSVLRWRDIKTSYWLGELKANEPKKWKQVVSAMYQELTKDPSWAYLLNQTSDPYLS